MSKQDRSSALGIADLALAQARGAASGALLPAVLGFAEFFGVSGLAGTPDYTATIAVGTNFPFPQNGATGGQLPPTRLTSNTFRINAAGIYQIYWQASITEPGQMELLVNGLPIPGGLASSGTVGRATGTSQLIGSRLISLALGDIVSIGNPAANSTALTVTPNAGGTQQVVANLQIRRLA